MKLYLISQEENIDYDTYDSFVVCAENETDAKTIRKLDTGNWNGSWVKSYESIKVEYLGEAREGLERGEILGSFNPG